ncbi:MAG: prepilin peptidase [bacterium]
MSLILLISLSACIGSFLNMLIHRLPREEDIFIKRSHCPNCNKTLRWFHLIPLLSFIGQKGHCSFCKKKISLRYLIVEIASICIAILTYSTLGIGPEFWKLSLGLYILLACYFTDLETQILPNSLTIGLVILGLGFSMYHQTLVPHCLAILYCSGSLIIIEKLSFWYYKKPALGWGDIKLSAGLAAMWGLKITSTALFLSFLIGGIYAIYLITLKKRSKTSYLAFGPFIIIGTLISLKYSDAILTFYGF